MAMPAAAEAGKLFDFNLTLPIMAGEILLLMVFLDKFWFTPVGKVSSPRSSLFAGMHFLRLFALMRVCVLLPVGTQRAR
jgi:hypothetical protein